MQLGRVIGNIVATVKHHSFNGHKLMLVQPLGSDLKSQGDSVIAVDTVQAGEGDLVLVLSEGNSTRQILQYQDAPIRSTIVGIVDQVNKN